MEDSNKKEFKRLSLWININRLVVITALLLLLKLFAYTVQEFLPVFSHFLGQVISALLPFIIAFVLAFLFEPLIQKIIKSFNIRRTYAALVVITLGIILTIFVLVLLGSRLYRELAEMTTAFPLIYDKTITILFQQVSVLENYIELNPEIQNTIRSSAQELISSAQVVLTGVSKGVLSFLGALPGLMIVIIVTTVATLLTSMSFPTVKEWFFRRFKGKYNAQSKLVAADLGNALVGFLRAQTILVSITMLVTTVGLLILGNKYAFTIGIVAGLLDLVPIIGPSIIFLPWTLILLFTGGFTSALKLFMIFIAATVIRQMLEPKIMSKNIGLHPLPTLISMYVGLKLLGAGGLILGPTLIIIFEALRKVGFFKRI